MNNFNNQNNPFPVESWGGSHASGGPAPLGDMGANAFGTGFNGMNKQTEFGSGAIRSVRVISCNFIEMVEQANMGFRPFVSNVTNSDVMDMIPQFVANNRAGANFKSQNFNPIVNDIVSLSSNSLGGIPLVNGWNIRRYSFAIKAEIVRSNGNTQNYLIEGFTDTPSLSTQHERINIDPNMVLYVNNVVGFSERMSNLTGFKTLVPFENYNVISKDPFAPGTQVHQLVTQRPYDITNMSVGGLLAGNTSSVVADARSSVATEAKTSNLSNNNPTNYVAKIINEGINAIDRSNTDNIFNTTAVRNMLNEVGEPALPNNGFLKQLGKISKDYATAVTSFTWGELTALDNALLNPMCTYLNVYPAVNRAVHLPPTGLSCDDVNGSGNEQVFAAMIANGITDLMNVCRATEVSVMATNASCVDQADVTSMRCFDQADVPLQSQLFEKLFIANIIQMMNHNTQFQYNIAVQCSMWSETYVKINLGYGNFTFLFPNFANSMYSPMVTNQKAGTEDISRHLLSFANRVNDAQDNLSATSTALYVPQNGPLISPI